MSRIVEDKRRGDVSITIVNDSTIRIYQISQQSDRYEDEEKTINIKDVPWEAIG